MKHRLIKFLQLVAAWQSNISHRIDLFWEKEDSLYYKDKIAYAHRGFLFFTSIAVVFTAILLLSSYLVYGEVL